MQRPRAPHRRVVAGLRRMLVCASVLCVCLCMGGWVWVCLSIWLEVTLASENTGCVQFADNSPLSRQVKQHFYSPVGYTSSTSSNALDPPRTARVCNAVGRRRRSPTSCQRLVGHAMRTPAMRSLSRLDSFNRLVAQHQPRLMMARTISTTPSAILKLLASRRACRSCR